MAQILYFGDSHLSSTSAHRAHALERLGHIVNIQDPYKALVGTLGFPRLEPIHYRMGYRLLQKTMMRWVEKVLSAAGQLDAVWINSGELFGPSCLALLKRLSCPIILYNNDDPTGGRDGRRFDTLLKAIQCYDICAVMREINVAEYTALGAKRILKVHMSYDEIAQKPFDQVSDIPTEFRSEVAFIGTWMRNEKRDEFLLSLLKQGVPVSIWGNRWQKSRHWQALKSIYRGGSLSGRSYVAAIQGSKICLGLLSKGNRDLHTQRSLEVPFAGGLLCAEHTSEHAEMYEEGVEAVFWSDAAQCAKVCHELLADGVYRERIRLAGIKRVREMHAGNEDVCREILAAVSIIA